MGEMEATRIAAVPFLAPINNAGMELAVDPGLGRRVLYQSFYADAPDRGPALLRLDFERHEYRSFAQPAGRGTWQPRLLADGKVWFGMNGPGQLACFDPAREVFEPVPPHRSSRPIVRLCDVVEGPDARLYLPAGAATMLLAYDREARTYQEIPVDDDGNQQLAGVCATGDGRIGVSNGLQHGLYAVDPQTGNVEIKSPEHLFGRANSLAPIYRCGEEFLMLAGGEEGGVEVCRFAAEDLSFIASFTLRLPVESGRRLCIGPDRTPHLSVDGGSVYRLDLDRETAELAYQVPGVPCRALYFFLDPGRILVATVSQYYGIYDVDSGTLDLHRSEVDNPPVDVHSILADREGTVYCSSVLGMCLSRVEPETGKAEILGLASDGSGEIYGSVQAGEGRIYSIAYTHALLAVYDPEKQWKPGRDKSSNPRNLGPLGEDQYRPVTGILRGPLDRLYAGTMPAYGSRGGALTVIDPETDTWKVYRNLVPDHSVTGLALGAEFVYVGTSVEADGYIAPAAGDACFLIFCPREERVLLSRAIEGAHAVTAMGHAAGKVFFWVVDHEPGVPRLFAYEKGGIRPAAVGIDLLGIAPRPMTLAQDGRLLFAAQGEDGLSCIGAIHPREESVEVIWSSERSENVVLAQGTTELFFARGHELWKLV